MIQVWATTFDQNADHELEGLYQEALQILNAEDRERVERFYHRIDSSRGLLGRLLIRMLLKEHGIPLASMSFAKTPAGKPYVTAAGLAEPIGYNITHDNGLVAMAFATGADLCVNAPAYRIGVDAMLLHISPRHTYEEFVESVSDQLTPFEVELLLPPIPLERDEAIRRFYLIWTLKEAYTKALGSGLGFDFKRIEYDVPRDVVRIDGARPIGWKFIRFDVDVARGAHAYQYVGVVVRYIGAADHARGECVVEHRPPGDWLKVWDAAEFVRRAIRELKWENQ